MLAHEKAEIGKHGNAEIEESPQATGPHVVAQVSKNGGAPFFVRRWSSQISRRPCRASFLPTVSHYQQRPDQRRRLDGGPRHAPHPQGVIRTAARALIVRDGKILTVVLRDREGDFYVLPGGGQAHG